MSGGGGGGGVGSTPLPVSLRCETCDDSSLIVYEPSIGSFICSGCGSVLQENVLVLTEPIQRRGEPLTLNLVPFEQSSSAFLSRTAAASASRIRSAQFEASKVAALRRKLQELCAQLELPSSYSSLSLRVLLQNFLPAIKRGSGQYVSKEKLVASIYAGN